mmetsp:Transcript_30679/g.52581  ORF Transcript_30679/g.52581 Transcript_30679/m.52581 type:complete len:220 (-) Transcript_30679:229-888(-)
MHGIYFIHQLFNTGGHRRAAEQHAETEHKQRRHAGQIAPRNLHSWIGDIFACEVDRLDADIEPTGKRQNAQKFHHAASEPLLPFALFIEERVPVKVEGGDGSEDIDQQQKDRNHRHRHNHVPERATSRDLQGQRRDVKEHSVQNLVAVRYAGDGSYDLPEADRCLSHVHNILCCFHHCHHVTGEKAQCDARNTIRTTSKRNGARNLSHTTDEAAVSCAG